MTLQEEIQNGESRTLEYKAELPQKSEKWIKSIVAFEMVLVENLYLE